MSKSVESTAFKDEKKTIIFPCWRDKRKHWFFIKDFTGALAMWAVRQSPYDYPKDLSVGLTVLKTRLEADFTWTAGMREFKIDEIRTYLCEVFDQENVFKDWNTPKVGNHTVLFVTRSSRIKPDIDFIATDAMAQNISHIMFIEFLHWED